MTKPLKPRPPVYDKSSIKHGATVRKCFLNYFQRELPNKKTKVALLLSGGIDSAAVGIALSELGHDVHAYTFRLGDQDSIDSTWAEYTANKLGWEFNKIDLPTDLQVVINDWPRMYNELLCRKKVQFECGWPMMHTFAKIQEKYVASGLAADSFFGLSRKAIKIGAAGKDSNKEIFDQVRRDMFTPYHAKGDASLGFVYNPSCARQVYLLAQQHKKKLLNPYFDPALYNHFIKFSWHELNTPRQKHHIVGAFPKQFDLIGQRPHTNFQLAANIDHHFEQLLSTPLNFGKRKRTLEMYNDWKRYDSTAQLVLAQLAQPKSTRNKNERRR